MVDIKAQATRLGFCALGVAPAQLDEEWVLRLSARAEPPYVPWAPRTRCSPRSWLEGARSVLVGAISYHSRYQRRLIQPGPNQGYISPFAQGQDYHELVAGKLEQLGSYMADLRPGTKFAVQADNGPGCERIFALRAGVGWQGKNNFIIVPKFGSFVWLGLLTTDLELPRDKPLESLCGQCTRCITACPTKAYSEPNEYDHNKCMAYWAGEKGDLSPEQCRAMSEHKIIYGCDYCQLACPHNLPGSAEDGGWPLLEDLLSMTKTQFQQNYKSTAAGWRGLNVLKRNAVIAAAGDNQFRGQLEQLAQGQGLAARQARAVLKIFDENHE